MNSNSDKKLKILMVGTGGQGVLTGIRLLSEVLVEQGHQIVSGQLHGMAQRGGPVQSSLMINSGTAPIIAKGDADFIIGLEPVETVRALPYISKKTTVIMNEAPVIPFTIGQAAAMKKEQAGYPKISHLIQHIKSLTSKLTTLNASELAQAAGSIKSLNMVMLGVLLSSGRLPCSADEFWTLASKRMPPKLLTGSEQAFKFGMNAAKEASNE